MTSTTRIRIALVLEIEVDGIDENEIATARDTAIEALDSMCGEGMLLTHMPDETGREIRLGEIAAVDGEDRGAW